MSNIWLPPGHQFAGLKEARQAVQDYDADLDFGLNQDTGQWCVFLKRGTNELTATKDLPVLGFNHIPGRDEVQKRLYQTDALRRGREVLDEWNRHNDKLQAEKDAKIRDDDGHVAEMFEWGFRKKGAPQAPIKVFMPGDK